MPRVVSLYLPDFATDRLRRIDRAAARHRPASPEPARRIEAESAVAQGGGWRPGARWARDEGDGGAGGETGGDAWLERRLARKRARKAALQAEIDLLPIHQRPQMRELGRRSEAAPPPFRAMPADDGAGFSPSLPDAMGHDLSSVRFEPVENSSRQARTERTGATTSMIDGADAPTPFRPMRPDEGAALAAQEPSDFGGHVRRRDRPAYDLAGAFWEQGAALGRKVARAVDARSPPQGQGHHSSRHPGRDPGSTAPRIRQAPEPSMDGPRISSGVTMKADEGREPRSPLVTTMRDGQRVVLAAVCPVARALGLAPGMALTQARAMVPGLDARAADPAGEGGDLDRLARHAARHWTPLAAPMAGGGLFLDITGSAHLFGGEARLCRRILHLCRRLGLAARIAVADTPGAARALAIHGGAAIVLCPPGGVAAAVAPLPLAGLDPDAKAAETARRLGIDTIGALAAMPRGPVARRFGRALIDRLDRTMGVKSTPIDPISLAMAPFATRRFAEPVMTPEGLAHALGRLAAELVAALAARGLGARALLLDCVRIDHDRQRIALGLARPSRDVGHLTRLLAMRIEEIEPGFGIEAMTLTATRADRQAAEAIDGALAGPAVVPDIAELIDRLVTRLGPRRLYRLGMVESEVPERSEARRPPLGLPAPWPDDWPRPIRLLDPAEPVDQVLAELPDHPPRRFRWRGRPHRVVRGDGPERIHGEWWRRPAEGYAVRDYFQVEDEAGARFWLYRRGDGVDGRTGDMSWHVHGLFG